MIFEDITDQWAMQGVRTVYSTTWEEKTRKATNPVSQIHSTPFGRHRQHDWPGQAVWIGTGSLWLEEARSRLLCSRPMMMTGQLPQQSTTLGSRHAPHGTTIFTMPNSHLLKSWHLCPLWYRSSERSYWTLTDKIGLNFNFNSSEYGHFYLWIVKKTSNIRSR